jgi:hypothetical protein
LRAWCDLKQIRVKMKLIKKVFYILLLIVTSTYANGNRGFSLNASFSSPVAPFQGIAGCQLEILKNVSDKLAFGMGVNYDFIFDGWFGDILHVKPEIVYTLKNSHKHSYYFYINSGLGLSYTHLNFGTKLGEWENIHGLGCHLDLVPSYKFKKYFSIGIGSWNSIVLHSKSKIKNRTTTFVSKLGLKFGIDI